MLNNIWENFLKIVKEEAGSRVVDTWFKAVFLHEWDSINKIVYLRVPNTFVRDWMSSNYTELINLHLSRLLNVDQLKVVLIDGVKKESLIEKKTGSEEATTSLVPAKVDYSKTSLEKHAGYKKSCHINSNFHFDNFVV
ncbi:MAG: hypothetical protein ACD_82C00062G0004, partial [uncultured bacterium]